jgi:CRP-like cAMP-binding protein
MVTLCELKQRELSMPADKENILLATLSSKSRERLMANATAVELPLRTSLYEAERMPAYAYFPTSGVASVVTTMSDGATAEVGLIGREGVVGSLHLLGNSQVSTHCFVQLEATALRIPMAQLQKEFQTSEEIRRRILEFVQEQALSVSQLAACQRLHEAEARLGRWLLMARDRTQSETLEFTQEFLAMMLGAQRTTVTMVAGGLQRRGLIEYRRGRVKITDTKGLEAAACDCYQVTRRLYANLYKDKERARVTA